MSDVGKPPGDAIDLRNQAEALVRGKATASPEAPEVDVSRSPLDAQKLLHELQVHQIELELQNEELRRSQLELETERIRYFDLYNLAPVGYCTLDEKSVVIEANLTAASLFGVTRNALVQCPLSRFIQAKDLGLFHRHTTRLLETGETQAWDMRLLKTNGTPWWGHVVATATQDTEGAAVVRLAVTDLTQRKQAEEALREVENRFSMAIAAVEDGIWDWNVITGNAFFSASYYRTLGYEDSEFQANYANWRLLVHPEDLARVEGDLLDAVASGQGFSIDLRMRMKSGNWRWVVTRGRAVELGADGKAQRMIGTMSDITERKKAEAALLESEERWKFAIEGAGDGLWDWNVQTGEAYYSPRYKEMLGYTDADFGAASDEWSKRIHPDDAPGVFAGLQPYMEGKPGTADVEFRMLCKDGTWRWMQGRGLVVSRDTDGKPLRMIGTNADITERKQAKDMLTQSEARHSSMVANISDVIGIIGVDGIMKYKSPNIQKWFGWEPQDLIGTDGWLTVHPDDLERIQHEFQTILEQDGASAEVEYRYKCKDGSYKYIALTAINLINDPAIAGVLLNYYDVTDRKQAGEALRESEHNFRGMFENSADGILLVSLDGHVRDANPMACKMNGYTHHEFVGMHGSEFVHPDHVWQFRDSIAATQAGESYKAESVNLRKNGTPLPIEVRITPFTHQGEPVLLCNIHDITEHKLAAEALKKSEKDYRTLINNLSSGVVVH
ncbi:MAG: PAS domain-containing protein, partial [Verrucomicrobiota bacterium]